MAVVTGHTCNGGGFAGSRPKEERQRDCPACQRQALAAKGFNADIKHESPKKKQRAIDISNLRFYGSLFRKHKWDTDVIGWGVFEVTLNEIADRLAAVDPEGDQAR